MHTKLCFIDIPDNVAKYVGLVRKYIITINYLIYIITIISFMKNQKMNIFRKYAMFNVIQRLTMSLFTI